MSAPVSDFAPPASVKTQTPRPPAFRGVRSYVFVVLFAVVFYLWRDLRIDDFAGANRANLVLYYAIIVIGFNYVFGVSGQLAFSQAAFVGVGAYTSNWASINHSFLVGLLAALIVCSVIAAVFGWLLRKADHFYFAIATLAFSEIFVLVVRNWQGLLGPSSTSTGGDIVMAKPIEIFGFSLAFDDMRIFTLLLGVIVVLLVMATWFNRSPMRREAIAARDKPMVAATLGVPVQTLNLRTYVVGSALAGMAGSIFVHWNGFATPESFGVSVALAVFLMMVIGGVGSFWGAIVGAFFYVYAPVFFESLEEYREIVYGALLMVAVIVMPQGIVGIAGQLRVLFYRFVLRRPAPATVKMWNPLQHFGRRTRTGEHVEADTAALVPETESAEVTAADVNAIRTRDLSEAVPTDTPPILEAHNIEVNFGGVRAVAKVTLGLAPGEVLGLVGPNGSGKSSFLNALSGVVPATGTLKVRGHEHGLGAPRSVWNARVARAFQTPQTFMSLTCIENVLLGTRDRKLLGLFGAWLGRPFMIRHEKQRWTRAAAALERFGLGALAESPASGLAYGQQRMLEIARVVASEPDVILLDEPSAGLNAAETENLAQHLVSIRSEGISLLVVDHKIDFITTICDRVAVLEFGELVTVGSPEAVWGDERVIAAYLGTE